MKPIIILVGLLVVGAIAYVVWGQSVPPQTMQQEQITSGQQTPNSAEGAPAGSIHNLPVPPAVAAVRAKVAADAGVPESQVLIETAYEREWSDGCLGLGGPAESCLMAITPGWEVTASAKGQSNVYRTNADGSVIRQEP